MPENIILVACGSFNPPTLMHFRMFEIARDHFHQTRQTNVIGGIVSPVHESYHKPNVALVSAAHRRKMVKMSASSSEWIRMSSWESKQQHWTKTYDVLKYHQNYLNSLLNDEYENFTENLPNWAPPSISNLKGSKIRIKLLCGADLFESFANRDLWTDSDLDNILGEHGVVVIARHDSNPHKFIFDSDKMFEHQNNITIIENWVPCNISSTVIRLHLRRGLSVKYLLNDDVIQYIKQKQLYASDPKQKNKTENSDTILPSDIIIIPRQRNNKELDMDVTDSPAKKDRHLQNDETLHSRKRKYSRGNKGSKHLKQCAE